MIVYRVALDARELPRDSDDTIDLIADRVGFASPSHFSRTFRRVHGIAPGRWRRTHRVGFS